MLFSRGLLLATVFTMSVAPTNAQQPSVRHGLTGGFIAGAGQNIPDRCVTESLRRYCPDADILDFHAGWMFRPDLALVGRLTIIGASGFPAEGGILGVGVRYWPATRRLWLSGEAGFGSLDSSANDGGPGLSGAAGFEVLQFNQFAVGAHVEWLAAPSRGARWLNNASLAFMFDWFATQ